MMKKITAFLLTAFLLIAFLAFAAPGVQAEPAAAPELPRSEASLAMEEYLEADPELMALMEKSIASAAQVNPDQNTNPVRSVDELYDFLDWATICMPWNVLTDVSYPTLFDSIDQSIGYIWSCWTSRWRNWKTKGIMIPFWSTTNPSQPGCGIIPMSGAHSCVKRKATDTPIP